MDIGVPSPRPPSGRTLESRYAEYDRPVLLTGIQALVRVLLEQARRDRAAGHTTAGLVSGYRGSPLGGLDQELWRRASLIEQHGIRFQPGLNEDLAATMVWGAQQLDAFPGKRVEGVFGLWYGKGPGVDRSGDPFRAANMLGTSAMGGVLAVAGDDHGAQSSVYPHQTDHVFHGVMMPVLAPAGVQDILDFGLAGYAMSRFSGLWVAMKLTSETAEQGATVTVARPGDPASQFYAPRRAAGGPTLNYDPSLVFPRDRAELERRLLEAKIPAALAWARENRIDRLIAAGDAAPLGLVTVGKAHADAVHALRQLGLEGDPRIAVYKVGLTWPIEAAGLRDFARGKRVLLVVEEKRSLVEAQLRDALYNLPADARPAIIGKAALDGSALLPAVMEIAPEHVAAAIAGTLRTLGLAAPEPPHFEPPAPTEGTLTRTAAFCAGCPHATSTRIPDGSYANAGIGCHFLAMGEDDVTRTFSQMGGEGAGWAGMAPFTDVPHMFINLGDGTYQHSGSLAIRQAVAAGTNATYKILFNDAVAMTGGQPAESGFGVTQIAAQVAAEGVAKIAIVADDVARLPPASRLPPGVTRHGRDELDAVQKTMRETPGTTVIIYDQVCATEKRRRRKRGTLAQPEISVRINPQVCENCGDCSTQSGCIAIEPIDTALGRKRRINPTSCNVDLSCLKGFCPSFVTIDGPPRAPAIDRTWQAREAALGAALPPPSTTLGPQTGAPWRGLFAGIGGGGIVTAGAIVAQAAHLEGCVVSTLDFTGMAQKNGAVVSHVQIGRQAQLDVVRIPAAQADVMIAADLAVAAGPDVISRVRPGGAVVGNVDLAATAAFKHDATLPIDAALHRRAIERQARGNGHVWLHGEKLAERLFGNAQAMNTMLLGVAWQNGLLPVGEASLMQAIELNGAALEMNRRAFLWGRILAAQPALADDILADLPAQSPPAALEALIEQRAAYLAEYQNTGWARLYRARVAAAVAAETQALGRAGRFARAAAEGWFRVMSYKDEYEVARLHAQAGTGSDARVRFHMAPPLITRRDAATGRRRKIAVPGWLALPLFRVLRHGKHLRGTALDVFGRQEDRRMERAMIDAYAADIARAIAALRPETVDAAAALADWPDLVRGFGPVKLGHRRRAEEVRTGLLAALDRPVLSSAA
jgi:indolepyruvate ferredoxin oxidoreductase